jgi:hypothetical protein
MEVNRLLFLTSVSRNLQYRTAQYVKNQTPTVSCDASSEVVRIHNRGGFHITIIHCDFEFRPLMMPILDRFQGKMNFTAAREHVPEGECNN